ncbi:MAG: N-methyl-L-tryptophan oxidase [Pirellulales bacterium]
MTTYDCIVVGCGAVGSAAAYHLASRGLRVLALDRFSPPHDRGSSHGRTRMIRQAYFEHPDYVPLVLRAYGLWEQLAAAAGEPLYQETGLLEIGPPDGHVVPGVLSAAAAHGLAVDSLSLDDIRHRFPGFRVPAGMVGVFERHAGFLHVERCIAAQVRLARTAGAELRFDEPAISWQPDGAGVVVETANGRYSAGRLILTAGAWAGTLLAELDIPLKVRRKPQYWFAPTTDAYTLAQGCPSFLYETIDDLGQPAGVFYGFPVVGPEGLKCAEHSGGLPVADPAQLERAVDQDDLARVQTFLRTYMPGVTPTLTDHAPCMYTMSPDENFLVDRHPQHSQVAFVAGLSGHGFKFACVLGEALADLSTNGQNALPMEFLSCRRFAN